MRSTVEDPPRTSPFVFPDLPSTITLGLTSVDPSSTYSLVTLRDDVHVNLSSHDDESSSFAALCGFSSTCHPIFYYDDDIMEEITTPDFIYPPLHRNHTFKQHTSCVHYIET